MVKLDIYDLEDCLKLGNFISSSWRFAFEEKGLTRGTRRSDDNMAVNVSATKCRRNVS